jgi:hypothetical protein
MFTTGQVDPVNWKRTDFPDYLTAAQSLLNVEVGTTGLAKKRKGTQWLFDPSAYSVPTSQIYEFEDNNGNFYILESTNAAFNVFNIDATTGDVTFYQTISDTPYQAADLPYLDYANDNDVITFVHPNYPPARIYVSSYSPDIVFSYQVLTIYPMPAFDFGNINYNGFTVSSSQTGSVLTFSFTGVGANPGYTNAWIGGQIVGAGASVNEPVGYAIITAVSYSSGGGGTVTFTGAVQLNFASPGSTSGAQYSVRQPAFSSTLGYPTAVLFYQNRLWFANTKSLDNTVFGSSTNSPLNFDVGVGGDTNAIIYTIGQTNSGGILWLNGGKQLEIYCQNFEFAAPQEQNIGLTPSTFSIRQQSAYGASNNLKPITYINDSYYVTKTGKSIINFHFNGIGQTYTSSNISVPSQLLVKNPKNRALLRGTEESQDNFVYFLNPDSTITAFQFATEYKLAALTPIIFGSEDNPVQVYDLASINNQIYMLKYYTLTNTYAFEKFVTDFKVDGYIDATMADTGVVTGLAQFNGYNVQVIYNNQDFGQYIVSGGIITVYNPNSYTGTVQIGFLYPMEIRPMFLFAGDVQADYTKKISRIYVDYYNSLNFYVNDTLVNYQYFNQIQQGFPLMPQSGTAVISPVLGWERFQTFNISQNSPFDCQILGIAYQIEATIV